MFCLQLTPGFILTLHSVGMHGFGYLTHYHQYRPFLMCEERMAELLECVSH